MIRIEFNGHTKLGPRPIYFRDLEVNEAFRVKYGGKGAIYIKCQDDNNRRFGQMELVSGKIFMPTCSEVEIVNISVKIEGRCPQIYNNLPNVTEDIPF